jgi:hypothetical protein
LQHFGKYATSHIPICHHQAISHPAVSPTGESQIESYSI